MSREEREKRAFFDEIDRKAPTQIRFDTSEFLETMKRADQIKESTRQYEAAKAAEKKHLEEVARNPAAFNAEIRAGFNKAAAEGGLKEMLGQIDKQIKANQRREQAYIPKPKKNKASLDHLEELHDIDYRQLIEARAERTKAELIEDHEQVEELNKEIKGIEERLSFYSEQMKILEAEETGEDGSN